LASPSVIENCAPAPRAICPTHAPSATVVGLSEPFGRRFRTASAAQPRTSIALPGQIIDIADRHYNMYRDYDPTLGRYLQADPIGLAGGDNVYGYVEGNPVNRIDPKGLFGFLAIPFFCGAGGCEALGLGLLGAYWISTHPITLPVKAQPLPRPDAKADCLEADPNKPCRTISGKIVPVGTIAYRPLDTPNRPQHGIVGSHYNLYRANKNPNNGICFWQSIGAVPAGSLPHGAIAIEPFAN
jgi:RHS repeat-associated protein